MFSRNTPSLLAALLVASFVSLAACGEDDPAAAAPAGGAGSGAGGSSSGGAGGSSAAGAAGQSASGVTKVTAASGGTVTDPGGKASLVIPAGALAADTDISLVVGPAETGTAGEVLTFGPDGTTFATPATLSIKADASKLVAGKTFALGTFEGGAWKEIAGSTYDGTTVKGPIAHFSKYSIVLVDGSVVVDPDSECATILASFAPCGGALDGTWAFKDICAEGVVADDPFKGTCPSAVITAEVAKTGEISFAGGNFTVGGGSTIVTTKASFPTSCLGNGKTCQQASDDITKQANTTGSCVDTAGTCACNTVRTTPDEVKTVPYTLSGNTFVHEGKSTEYCVSGSTLLGRDVGTTILSVLTKK